MQAGSLLANATRVSRVIFRRSTIAPFISSPATLQLFLPKSIPSTAIGVLAVYPLLHFRTQPASEAEGRPIHKARPVLYCQRTCCMMRIAALRGLDSALGRQVRGESQREGSGFRAYPPNASAEAQHSTDDQCGKPCLEAPCHATGHTECCPFLHEHSTRVLTGHCEHMHAPFCCPQHATPTLPKETSPFRFPAPTCERKCETREPSRRCAP
jgi:hypothetical protein